MPTDTRFSFKINFAGGAGETPWTWYAADLCGSTSDWRTACVDAMAAVRDRFDDQAEQAKAQYESQLRESEEVTRAMLTPKAATDIRDGLPPFVPLLDDGWDGIRRMVRPQDVEDQR